MCRSDGGRVIPVDECLIDIETAQSGEDLLEPLGVAVAAGLAEAAIEGGPDAGAPLFVFPLLEAKLVDLAGEVFGEGERDPVVIDQQAELGQLELAEESFPPGHGRI